jgi:hypothetical protein
LSSTLLLASHPDETNDANGDPLPHARTFVLELKGNQAVVREELPLPLVRSWYSESGTAYCGSVQRKTIHKLHAGQWSEEVFSDVPVDFVRSVYVWPGEKPQDDTVFLTSSTHVFVRQAGAWQSKRVPYEGFPFQMAGTRADQVFIGGTELCLWDGKDISLLESPRDDTIDRLAISADDRLVGGSRYLSASKPDGTWERIATPIKGWYMFARLGDRVYALSDHKGVVSVYPGPVSSLTRPLDAIGLVAVGDGLIAIGTDGVLAFDGQQWTDVHVPVCEVGKQPV